MDTSRKFFWGQDRRQQEIKEFAEPDETKDSDTIESKNTRTEIKRKTDQWNHITMIEKATEQKKNISRGYLITDCNFTTG